MGAQKGHGRMPRPAAPQHSLPFRSNPAPPGGQGWGPPVWPPLIVQTRDPRHLPTLPVLRGGCRLAPRPSPHPCNRPSNRNTFPLSLTQVCVSNPERAKPRAPHLPEATAGPSDPSGAAALRRKLLTLSAHLRDGTGGLESWSAWGWEACEPRCRAVGTRDWSPGSLPRPHPSSRG